MQQKERRLFLNKVKLQRVLSSRLHTSGKRIVVCCFSSPYRCQLDIRLNRFKIKNDYALRLTSKLDAYGIVEFGDSLLDEISEELEEEEEPYIFYSSDNNLSGFPSVHIQAHTSPTSSSTSLKRRRCTSSLYSIPEED